MTADVIRCRPVVARAPARRGAEDEVVGDRRGERQLGYRGHAAADHAEVERGDRATRHRRAIPAEL